MWLSWSEHLSLVLQNKIFELVGYYSLGQLASFCQPVGVGLDSRSSPLLNILEVISHNQRWTSHGPCSNMVNNKEASAALLEVYENGT